MVTSRDAEKPYSTVGNPLKTVRGLVFEPARGRWTRVRETRLRGEERQARQPLF